MLSVRYIVVHVPMSKQSSMHDWWSTLPAISRSLLVTWPSGLSQETSCAVMSVVKFARHIMGCDIVQDSLWNKSSV